MTSFLPHGKKIGAAYGSHAGEGVASVEEAFKHSGGQLLILGEAGAGKTYAMMALLRGMLSAALQDGSAPVPFYLDLSDWRNTNQRLEEWILSEIEGHYGAHRGVLQLWQSCGEIAVALDGLDELRSDERDACIQAIGEFRKNFPLTTVVLACRTREYRQARKRFSFPAQITISDISNEDLTEILKDIDSTGNGLAARVETDRNLRDLLRRPLFLQLSAMSMVYANGKIAAAGNTRGKWSASVVIDTYLSRAMLRSSVERNTEDVVPAWLPPLARHLQKERKSTFFPDRISLELIGGELRAEAQLYAAIVCGLATFITIAAARVTTWLFIPLEGPWITYLASGWVLLVLIPWVAASTARKRVISPPVGRRATAAALMSRVLPKFALMYFLLGALAPFIPNSLAATFFVVILLGVGTYPGIALLRSSEGTAETEYPHRPGEEIRQLRRSCIICVSAVTITMSASLFLVLGPMDTPGVTILPLRSWALLPYFVVPFATIVGVVNGGADLAARYGARKVLARHGLLPQPYLQKFDELRQTSIFVPSSGGLAFIHPLVRDHVAGLRPNALPSPRGTTSKNKVNNTQA
ncbi:NACHT domain-containing protein [Micromonospora ureilytica]|nr:NACHT domain-containing protein [Micromonospora ureilytica]